MAGSQDPTATSALQEHGGTAPSQRGSLDPQLPAAGNLLEAQNLSFPSPTPPSHQNLHLNKTPQGESPLTSKFGGSPELGTASWPEEIVPAHLKKTEKLLRLEKEERMEAKLPYPAKQKENNQKWWFPTFQAIRIPWDACVPGEF